MINETNEDVKFLSFGILNDDLDAKDFKSILTASIMNQHLILTILNLHYKDRKFDSIQIKKKIIGYAPADNSLLILVIPHTYSILFTLGLFMKILIQLWISLIWTLKIFNLIHFLETQKSDSLMIETILMFYIEYLLQFTSFQTLYSKLLLLI